MNISKKIFIGVGVLLCCRGGKSQLKEALFILSFLISVVVVLKYSSFLNICCGSS